MLVRERRKRLLVTHAGALFSVFAPDVRAAQLRPLGPFVVPQIAAQLHAEGLSERPLGELDPARVTIAQTTGGRSHHALTAVTLGLSPVEFARW